MARTLKARLCAELSQLVPLVAGEAVFEEGQPAFFVDARLVVEFSGSNQVGLRLTWPLIKSLKQQLHDDGRVDQIRSGTDWIYVTFRRADDIQYIVELVREAVPAYLPEDGRPLRPPPTGQELARLRRFH